MNLPVWDPDEYDREVRASRTRENRERRAGWRMSQKGIRAASTLDPSGPTRGVVTEDELARRQEMDRAMNRRARGKAGN